MYGVVSNVLVLPPMILCILLFKRSKNILKRKHRVDRGIEIGNITVIYDTHMFNKDLLEIFYNKLIKSIYLLIFKPRKRTKSICQKIVTLEQQEKQNMMKGKFTKKIWLKGVLAVRKRLEKSSCNICYFLGEQKDGLLLVELLHGWLLLHRLEVEHSSSSDWDYRLETIGRISGSLLSYFLLWRPCCSPNHYR